MTSTRFEYNIASSNLQDKIIYSAFVKSKYIYVVPSHDQDVKYFITIDKVS